MSQTLEQKRARDTWNKCQGCDNDYKNLAKGLPALIMNSGLMQVMAYLHEKGSKSKQAYCRTLAEHLRDWLHQRFPEQIPDKEFAPFMQALMEAKPHDFQQITTEAFAWLRWLRQMAPAVYAGDR